MQTEIITWHNAATDLPDCDSTVLVQIDPATPHSEPVWPGYLDGEQWRTAEGDPVTVVAWADMPSGAPGVAVPAAPKLGVWFGAMPESNGKANWTAILHRGDLASGHTIERSEHHDRVRYEADRVRWLIGELAEEPDLLAYDPDMLNPPDYEHPCGVEGRKP